MRILVGRSTSSQENGSTQTLYPQTKNSDTEIQYAGFVRRFMQQLEANQQDPTLENIVLLADRNTSVQQWSRPTVRLYRSAILFHIENQRIAGIISSEDAAKFEKLLKSLKGRPGRSERTSAKKAKHANELAIKRLAEKLDSSRSTVAVLAKGLFLSSVMVGLRPAEWFSAQLDDDKLVVKNGSPKNQVHRKYPVHHSGRKLSGQEQRGTHDRHPASSSSLRNNKRWTQHHHLHSKTSVLGQHESGWVIET
jgi:hypothetical protein